MKGLVDRVFRLFIVAFFCFGCHTATAQLVIYKHKPKIVWQTECVSFEERYGAAFRPSFTNNCAETTTIGYCASVKFRNGETIDNCADLRPGHWMPLHAYLNSGSTCFLFPKSRRMREVKSARFQFSACRATERTTSFFPIPYSIGFERSPVLVVTSHNGRIPLGYRCHPLDIKGGWAPSIGSKMEQCK